MKKWLRRGALGVLGILALVLLLLTGAWLFLQSGPGERFARKEIVTAVKDYLPGNLDIGGLQVSGNTILLTNLVLKDPEGNVVGRIAQVQITFSVLNLVQQNVDLSKVRVEKPELFLVLDERGFNLVRAVKKSEQQVEEKRGEPTHAQVHIRELEIVDGSVELKQSTVEAMTPYVRLDRFHATGSFDLLGAQQTMKGRLEVDGALHDPLEGALGGRVDFDWVKDVFAASSRLDVDGVRVDGKVQQNGTEKLRVDLSEVNAPHDAMKAFILKWPLIADAKVTGTMDREGNVAALDLHVSAGKGRVDIGGGLDLAKLRAEGLTVDAHALDFSELVEKGPKSDITLSLKATGGGTSLENLDGKIDLSVPKAALDEQPMGPIELHASAANGTFQVTKLDAQVPGASLVATGAGTVESIELQGSLKATNLALLGNTVGRIARPNGLPIAGSGALQFSVKGPPKHPGVSMNGAFASLRYDSYLLNGLTLKASVPDVLKPLDVDADLRAKTLQSGERVFRDFTSTIVTRGRELTADVSARGFADISLHVDGTRDENNEGMALSDIQLRYTEGQWKLQRPSHVSWGEAGTLLDEELVLENGRQRITVVGGMRGTKLDARALVENLDLQRLPRAAVPEDLNLAGSLNARIVAGGTTTKPSVDAKLTLRDGRVHQFEGLSVELDAKYEKDRAAGEVRVLGLNSGVAGNFDVPVSGLIKGTDEPLKLDLAVQATKLEALFAALKVSPGMRGDAAATIHADGTAKDPHVRIAIDGDHVQQTSGPPGDLDLLVESTQDGNIVARIDLDTMGSHSYLLLTTPWHASRFIRGPVNGRMFLEEPVALEGAFREIPLEALKAWGVLDADLKGKGSLTIDAKGAVKSPTGTVHLALKGTQTANVQPFDAFATVAATDQDVKFTLTAVRGQAPLADLEASFATGIGALIKGTDPEHVQLKIAGDLGPVKLSELRAISSTEPPPPPVEGAGKGETPDPDGVITAKIDADGTLADPHAQLKLVADKLGVGELALGKVDLLYRYAQAKSDADVLLTSAKGGQLKLVASTGLDLSGPAIRHGLKWKDAPVQASLNAAGFDPSFLSNVSQRVRELGGMIDANAKAGGTLGAPEVRGNVEWKDGRLALMGYGHYRNIHLAFEGTNDALTLKDLTLQSSGGTLKLNARGDRKGTQYALTGAGEFDRFPIIVDDQLRALLSGRLTLAGDASKELVFIRELAIPEAHIELPEVRRKDLQDLDRRDDIVLVRKGEPLYAKKKKPAAAGGGAEAGETATEENAAPQGTRYTVLVNAPRNIWVRGTDVNAEIGLSDGFRIEYQEITQLFGEVRFIRGRVDVLGRRFDVLKDSQVRFAGPARLPYINVTASHGNERENVTVFTTIRGQGSDVTIKVSSSPALSESEIYTLLATGRRTLKRGSGSSMTGNEAASVVGAYAASQVKKVLASKVPLDVLSIEAGTQGLADASLEAGTYLTDKIYIGSIYRLGADPERNENTAGFRLEYQITPRWSFETEYGTARAGGADLIWSKDY